MANTIEALFDGTAFYPVESVTLEPNTRVRITFEELPAADKNTSFLRTARSFDLEGPPDWSANFHKYMYDEETWHEK